MSSYRVSPANRRLVLLAVLSLIASLLTISFNAPAGTAASGDVILELTTDSSTRTESGFFLITATMTIDTIGGPLGTAVSVDLVDITGGSGPADYTLTEPLNTDPKTTFSWDAGTLSGSGDSIKVNIVPDVIDEGASEVINFELQNELPPPGTFLGTITTYDLTITDNDAAPNLTMGNSSLVEQNGNMVFTVVRNVTDTEDDIDFDYTLGGGSATGGDVDYDSSSGTGTITPGGSGQTTISVPINEDDFDEGASETFNVTVSVTSGNATMLDPVAQGTITDDDDAGVTISGPLAADEGATDTYTVELDTEPIANVFVTLADDGQTAVTVPAGGTLTFGPGDWGPKTVTVEATDDDNYEASPHTGTISHSVASPGDSDYDGISAASINMSITDNDPASVSFTNASSSAQEDGGTHSPTLTLTVPGGEGETLVTPVVVDITASHGTANSGDYTLLTNTVTFPVGKGTGETLPVNVSISNDSIPDANQDFTLMMDVASGGINGAQLDHVVTIIDDETRNILVTPTDGGTVVSEGAGTDTFAVTLNQPPTGSVTVTLTESSAVDEFNLSPAVLIFTTGDWNVDHVVTVTGVDDNIIDGAQNGGISLAASGGGYDDATAAESVTITDDDTAGASVTESGGTAVAEGGPADTYTIVLDAQPSATVTVDLVFNEEQIAVTPSSFVFTTSGWNTPKTFSVTALADGKEEPATTTETISHVLTSADDNFDEKPVDTVSVTVTDSDELQVSIEGPSFGAPGTVASFEAIQNASGTGTVTYDWRVLLNGVAIPGFTGNNATFEFTPTVGSSNYIVTARVGDDDHTGDNRIGFFIPFTALGDIEGNVFVNDIIWLAEEGITRGCNPPVNDQFCPSNIVTREQMAAFLVRFLDLKDDGGGNKFVDDDGSIFEVDIAKLAAAGITRGCNPPTNTNFCPTDRVTREQMAAFLVRALNLTDNGGGNKFIDDDGSIFEDDIAKLAEAGITRGCNPPTNTRFCPNAFVTRGQMAAFIHRADAILHP